jgi:hypothetical protein
MKQTEFEIEKESYGTTPLTIQVNVDEGVYNAVLWYESDLNGQGRELGKTIVKTKFEYSLTEPAMSTYFYKNDNLVTYLKSEVDPKAARAILYSKEGWQARTRVKRELEKETETCSLWLCFLTCGCAVCCCGLCGKCDKNTAKLNEDSYCSIMAELMAEADPGKMTSVAYELIGPAPIVVEGHAIES